MKKFLFLVCCLVAVLSGGQALAEDSSDADQSRDRFEERGERVNERLDRRGERINKRLDRKGERIEEVLRGGLIGLGIGVMIAGETALNGAAKG